jgi:pullulanase
MAVADWYFRGTSNSWSTTAMTHEGNNIYTACQAFANGDGGGGPRFKIDRFGDWSENYPASDYNVSSNTSYIIEFDAVSHSITTSTVSDCNATGYTSQFGQLYFRGTANNWSTLSMTLVDDYTWQATVNFDGQSNQRFKIDVFGDWSQNYGDNDANGTLEQFGSDIYTSVTGDYIVTVDDQALTYSLAPAAACTSNCAVEVDMLGAEYTPTATTFSIWSPDHSDVKVEVDGQVHTLVKVPDFNGYTDVYQVTVDGDLHLAEYTFLINNIEVRDPYGKMIQPQSQKNIVMDMSRVEPDGGWTTRPAMTEREDAVIYEVHVRDFTIDSSSGVSAANKGKFDGMVQAGTVYNGVKTGIDHLKELGVTHVQLLPVYDFATCDGLPDSDDCYNWGYDPRNYNIPEERYSKTPTDYENRVKEFKNMVNEFHKAGIRVIMDVVYNHTYGNEMFEDITNQYFYHQNLVVGNTIDDGVPMVSRMIQDSLEYWAKEYGIDGFRFDLVGVFGYENFADWSNNLENKLPGRNILMYGEPWPGCFGCVDERESSRVRLGTIGRVHDAHVGVFNPKYREAIKGQNDNGECNTGDCYAFNSNPDTWRVEVGSRGAIRAVKDAQAVIDTWDAMFAMDPEQSINYVSAHDNLTLRDKILEWATLNGVSHSSSYLRRIQNFANGVVLTSQGIPFLHGGVELLREKQGVHNSYNAGDAINKYQWQWKVDNADIFDYYASVIAMRNAHPGFRMNTWDEVNNHVTSSRPRYGVVVNQINAQANGDSWSDILVIYNSADNYTYTLPSGTWKVAMEAGAGYDANGRTVSGSIVAEGTAVTVLYKQ